MSKLAIGDYVYVDYIQKNGTVIFDRGGAVGRWKVKFDDGDTCHASTRDCTVLKSARPKVVSGLTVEQKLDLLLDYLELDIQDEPKIVPRKISALKSRLAQIK